MTRNIPGLIHDWPVVPRAEYARVCAERDAALAELARLKAGIRAAVERHPCPHCERVFASAQRLRDHAEFRHGGEK